MPPSVLFLPRGEGAKDVQLVDAQGREGEARAWSRLGWDKHFHRLARGIEQESKHLGYLFLSHRTAFCCVHVRHRALLGSKPLDAMVT